VLHRKAGVSVATSRSPWAASVNIPSCVSAHRDLSGVRQCLFASTDDNVVLKLQCKL